MAHEIGRAPCEETQNDPASGAARGALGGARAAWEQQETLPLLLKRGADQPVYLQLQDLIRGAIGAGVWRPGTAIPPEKALAQQVGVARMTVRQALDGLIRDGLLVRVRGRGTFVTHPRVERELTRMHGFSEDMRGRGLTPSTRVLARQVVPAPDEVSTHLRLGRREAVILLHRLRFADELPIALETSYLNYERCQPVLDANLETGSLYNFLEGELGLRLSHATQDLEARLPDTVEADLLQVSRRLPLLVIHQTTYIHTTVADEPLIRGQTVYRADRYHFRLEVPR